MEVTAENTQAAIDNLKAQQPDLTAEYIETMALRISALEASQNDFTNFIDGLWRDIILKHHPDYGNWEYPVQAHRHILEEFDDLRAITRSARKEV